MPDIKHDKVPNIRRFAICDEKRMFGLSPADDATSVGLIKNKRFSKLIRAGI